MTRYDKVKYEPLDGKRKVTCRSILDYLTDTKTLFYYCALISSWDDRSWYFLVGIYLVVLDPSNFTLAAVLGFLSSGMVLLSGSIIGSWSDNTSRLKTAMIILGVRNISTLLCSVCLCLVLFLYNDALISDEFSIQRLIAQIVLIACGVLAHVTGLVNNNMLSKDWLPIFCLGDSNLFTTMTARFRLIDLISNTAAPAVIGQIMTFAGKKIAAVVFTVQVMVTLLMFCFMLNVIYKRMPRLHYRENIKMTTESSKEYVPIFENEDPLDISEIEPKPTGFCQQLYILIEGWTAYFKQPILFAGLGLGLLYMTVLGFDSVTIGYGLSQGMTESLVSLFNAGAALTGVLGALIFPCLVRQFNVVYTGIISLFLQFIGLIPCIVSVWAPGSPFDLWKDNNILINSTTVSTIGNATNPSELPNPTISTSVLMLMGGIISSRVGLWMYDLTTTQLLVQTVPEIDRGKVNGVQNSLNMTFDMIKFGLVLLWPLPSQFGLIVILSVCSIGLANVFYMIFCISHRCKIKILL